MKREPSVFSYIKVLEAGDSTSLPASMFFMVRSETPVAAARSAWVIIDEMRSLFRRSPVSRRTSVSEDAGLILICASDDIISRKNEKVQHIAHKTVCGVFRGSFVPLMQKQKTRKGLSRNLSRAVPFIGHASRILQLCDSPIYEFNQIA